MTRATYRVFFVFVSLLSVLLSVNGIAVGEVVGLDKKNALTVDELIAGAKKEGKIVFYSAHSPFVTELLLKKFGEAYPFIKTDFVRGSGMVIGQRFYSEKSKGIENVDTIYSGAAEIYPDWKKKNYLARLDNLPEWGNVIDLAKGKDGQYVSFVFMTHVMAWNRKVFKDEDVPSDLWEFTKPQWKDKTTSGDPATAGFALNWFSFASDARPQDPRSKGKPSGLGFKWMEAMFQNGHLLSGQMGGVIDTLVSGRRPVLIQHWDQQVWEAIKDGANLGWKYPIQGSIAQHSMIAANAKSPHPHTARLFVNWLLSKEGQSMLAKEAGFGIVRKDMKTSDFIQGRKQIEECWVLDIESINEDETRDFIFKVNSAIRGKAK